MGIFSRSPVNKLIAGANAVDRAVDAALASGALSFPLRVNGDDFSRGADLGSVTDVVLRRLEERGLVVTQVDSQELSRATSLQVAAPSAGLKHSAAPRADELLIRLRPFTTRAMFGCPFGPGRGLEAATAIAAAAIPEPEERRERREVVDSFLTGLMQAGRIKFNDMDVALGVVAAPASGYGVTRPQLDELLEAVYEPKAVLAGRAEAVSRCQSDQRLADRCLAYFTVASERLIAAGVV